MTLWQRWLVWVDRQLDRPSRRIKPTLQHVDRYRVDME